MTKEEAIDYLQDAKSALSYKFDEAIDMAIEALQADTVSREDAIKEYMRGYKHGNADAFDLDGDDIAVGFERVVRCKDCRYAEHCHETVAHTKDHDGFREHWSEPIEWCSRGERREP